MKSAILFWLVMTAPDGSQWNMDSHLSLAECAALSVPGEITAYYDGESILPVPDGARMTCEAMGQEV